MIHLKKFITDDLLHLALILSFLKLNSIDLTWDALGRIPVTHHEISLGTSYGYYSSDYPNFLDNVHLERAFPSKIPSSELFERRIFSELNELGSFSRNVSYYGRNIYAYLLNDETVSPTELEVETPQSSSGPSDADRIQVANDGSSHYQVSTDSENELSLEDADLIEILWKQDIDLGIAKEVYDSQFRSDNLNNPIKESDHKSANDQNESSPKNDLDKHFDVWGGVNYTIDTETGEFITVQPDTQNDELPDLKNNDETSSNIPRNNANQPEQEIIDFIDNFSVEEALNLVGNNGSTCNISDLINGMQTTYSHDDSSRDTVFSDIQPPQNNVREVNEPIDPEIGTPSTPDQSTQLPLMNGFEERWQDVANLLDIPNNLTSTFIDYNNATNNMTSLQSNNDGGSLAPFHLTSGNNMNPVLIENATLPAPIQPLSPIMNTTNTTTLLDQSNFVSGVTNALSSLTNGSDPQIDNNSVNFTFENGLFPFANNQTSQNISNQTNGLLSGLINDEYLDLMGIAMNDSGVENHVEDKVDVSSDSAVSSMGSERFPAFSDGEWFDSNSETSQQDHHERYFGTDLSTNGMYSFQACANSNISNGGGAGGDVKYFNMSNSNRSNVPQKKYKFFGKRINQESPNSIGSDSGNEENRDVGMQHFNQIPDTKNYDSYNYSNQGGEVEGAMAMLPLPKKLNGQQVPEQQLHQNVSNPEFIYHNHTYGLPPAKEGDNMKPGSRDKITRKHIDNDKGLSRDERRAKELLIPLSIEDMVNLSMDEFNEKLSKYDFSETQLTLIRDIRRRGKNKVAAQNCRKRKLDQIFTLEDELKQLKDQKTSLVRMKENLTIEKETSYFNFLQLHDKILRSLILRQQQQQVSAGQPHANPENYTLQLTPDGNVYLAQRNVTNSTSDFPSSSNHRRHNSKN